MTHLCWVTLSAPSIIHTFTQNEELSNIFTFIFLLEFNFFPNDTSFFSSLG